MSKTKTKYESATNEGIIYNNFLDNKIFDEYFLQDKDFDNKDFDNKDFSSGVDDKYLEKIHLSKKDYKKAQNKEGQNFKTNAKNIDKLRSVAEEIKSNGAEFYKELSEGDIEDKIVGKILEILGFETLTKQTITINSIEKELDYLCFENSDGLKLFLNNKEESIREDGNNKKINFMIVEVKKWGANFESGKPSERPLRQITEYLILHGIKRGILTSGDKWWIVDVSNKAKKVEIIGIDLHQIIEKYNGDDYSNNRISLIDFYNIFKASNFFNDYFFECLHSENKAKSLKLEQEIKEVIYGEESILEKIGHNIYKQNMEKDINEIYYNSLVMLFRIIFMLFYENKYGNYIRIHRSYDRYSILKFFEDLNANRANYKELLKSWRLLDVGDEVDQIPMLNGGLFNGDNANLLNSNVLFGGEDLKDILGKLINDKDYKNLDINQLGNIYEGLLQYEFKIARADIFLIKYGDNSGNNKSGKKNKGGEKVSYIFVDYYGLESYKKEYKSFKEVNKYAKGSLYLSSFSNQRKTTASYYTPTEFTTFMVKDSIDCQLAKGINILDLKIIDNACGSGHFLVAALNYLSEKCDKEEIFKSIEVDFNNEKAAIIENIKKIVDDEELELKLLPTDKQIIKRLLLKKTIFGVDINKIAVEITKIGLWVETFIFGTPLSFVEHHIKCGNSLIFSSIKELKDFEETTIKGDLFAKDTIDFLILEEAYKEINSMNDISINEIRKSKDEYKKIAEKLQNINNHLNIINYKKFCEANKNPNKKNFKEGFDILGRDKDFIKFVKDYNPFNVEIEFPDVKNGFNVVLGNPPWDITEITEVDFYRQYITEYKSLTHEGKAKKKEEILMSFPYLRDEYESKQKYIKEVNELYKALYPLNEGGGKNNLYQFFMERNLLLMAENGVLSYLTPTGWIFAVSGKNIRKEILEKYKLSFLYCFENRNKLFDIDSRYKFGIYRIERGKTDKFKCFFLESDASRLERGDALEMGVDEIKKYDREDMGILELRDDRAKNIVLKGYDKFGSLEDNYIIFSGELHMTLDKEIMEEGVKFNGVESDEYVRMYEGKMVHQFNSKFSNQFTGGKYLIKKKNLPSKIQLKGYKLVFRAIARNTDIRTMIASLVPKGVTYGHSLFGSKVVEDVSVDRLLWVCGCFNSIIVDYILRMYVDMNVSLVYVKKLPIYQPETVEILENKDMQKIIKNVAMLTYLYNREDFFEFVEKYKLDVDELPKHEKNMERYMDSLKVENDCLILKMYGIDYNELLYMLESFKVLNKENPNYVEMLKSKYSEFV